MMASLVGASSGSSTAPENLRFLDELRSFVGRRHVLTTPAGTLRYRSGFRCGQGPALAVVRPGSLLEQWRVLKACVAANKILIMQAANTGLTGGSTPDGPYDRDVVIVSTLRIRKIRLINEGRQAICHSGATLFELEKVLKRIGREPHSVIGSSCIGASVIGGICNNSGGALIHRGPAYTQLALFGRVDEKGHAHLVNHLGIRLGNDPETILDRLDRDTFSEFDLENDPALAASDRNYLEHLRDINAGTAARFNADPRCLFEASGSAGKVMIFAVRLDTFSADREATAFYVGTNDPRELTRIRRHMLAKFKNLPTAAEYLHRDAFDLADRYCKDTFLAIRHLGTRWLPRLFALKGRVDALSSRWKLFPSDLCDKLLQAIGRIFPDHLPRRVRRYRDQYEHHLLLKMSGRGIPEGRDFLESIFPSRQGNFFECTAEEGEKAFQHRFVVAGAAIRYRAMHRRNVEGIVALDVALRRNDEDWVESLPDDITAPILHRLYYGHFFCHVFHQDYIVGKGHDVQQLERRMWALLDARGAQYPAEHNVGHTYEAQPALAEHYRRLDPRNCFNPGIGRTSRRIDWEGDNAKSKRGFCLRPNGGVE